MPRHVVAGLAGLVLAALFAASAVAYNGTVASTVDCNSPTAVVAGSTVKVTALVLDTSSSHKPIPNKDVTWSSIPSNSNVTLNPKHSVTNSHGIATTMVTILGGSTVTVKASADKALGSCKMQVKHRGLPNTSTVPLSGSNVPLVPGFIAIIAAVAAAGMYRLFGAKRI